jgi:alpha-galactosidase
MLISLTSLSGIALLTIAPVLAVGGAEASATNPSSELTTSTDTAILTPPVSSMPYIHGPTIFGLRPGSPFFYTIPATGNRPMTFSADSLPAGLQVDVNTGRIAGSVAQPGEYHITFHASNSLGSADRPFRLIVGNQIGLTPAMGWNSWNCWGEGVTQTRVLNAAQAMVRSGLSQHGWTYINIDDTWQGSRGGDLNAIQPDLHRFPDMKGIVNAIHQLGLKAGIYSTPWTTSYAGRIGGTSVDPEGTWQPPAKRGPYRKKILPYAIGPYSFATQDAKQWALWGIDYLKYDWGPVELPESREMADALTASGRDILFSISNNTSNNMFDEVADLSQLANSWRITSDISDNWASICHNGFAADKWAPFSGPGHFIDPDMLAIGVVGLGGVHRTRLTPNEQYSHVSLWCLLSAPLLLSCDLDKLDPFTLGLLTNDEVLDVDQDALGKQATIVAQDGAIGIYAKPLEDRSWAIGFFNLGPTAGKATLHWSALGLFGPQTARDLWRQERLGTFNTEFSTNVASHGVTLIRLSPL